MTRPVYRASHMAYITIDTIVYEYYVTDNNKLSMVEEYPTFTMKDGQIVDYPTQHTIKIIPIERIDDRISPTNIRTPVVISLGKHNMRIDSIFMKGGEAIVYKGIHNQHPAIFKTYIHLSRTLRMIPPELSSYSPRKYFLFDDWSKARFVVMELLQPLVYTHAIFTQCMAYLDLLDTLGVEHGDISPGNILQDNQGNLKVIDYARASSGGTPFYSQNTTDRQAMSRTLLGYKYISLINMDNPTLGKLYKSTGLDKDSFFNWLSSTFPQDEESIQLIAMAR
jgi:serine/threonine protein kinase